ncbi:MULTISPECIES: acetyl-CoA carboxylase biotin carboxyl carrier protein [Cellulophaga]|jgi:acetyl-CoA carboxylase biotin carboxyl carrier protein|uniref:Biotin carboxyl carrier protein of acetyl-CoA carboxylase n=2 Tax=Cellulophaga baltica TaxID=76594 RepID=A0A1G7FDG1_9FLAO|nr:MULTISPECIES: acetyl-CoA carboxylase biotin carboxyl carrier protein [Cellulophaga]WFO15138.1 acetyl-CoA carboxylase biotin carboxyl carrier protein [Cellulophaga baltica 4]AIY12512.1 acetyl-CoA carboxylase [Cellulophaga baltica NN016038]AIZ40878.1 acetyl-CoA carboxylase [Cellulophaga baltica 18]KGK31239.1 acetyl-CoA carboxylase [Cellulophaga sp. E6(2014)]MCR1025703.1 acetyl-CoA carboxylase biotin carboxyl carrier protein [Cellulophaga baltica]
MDIKEIQSLIKFVAKSGASEVKLEMEDIKITIRTGAVGPEPATYVQQIPMAHNPMVPAAPAPAQEGTPSVEIAAKAEVSDDDKYITIKSPIIGTFYRKASPEKPVFVEVGSVINKGDVLCVIEAMKLFNDIESEVSGKIVKVLVDDSSPVEFDQPLFLVDPS